MLRVIYDFAGKYDDYEMVEQGGQFVREFSCSYAYPEMDIEGIQWNNPALEYRFHINTLDEFKRHLASENIREEDVVYHIEPIYESAKVEFKIKPHFKPFPEQIPMIPQICNHGVVSKLLPLRTGGGKSYLSLVGAHNWGNRVVALMRPGFIPKWVLDIHKTLDIEEDKIVTVEGLDQLAAMITDVDMGRSDPHIVLISNATFRFWISRQEKLPPGEMVPGFPCTPWEFMQHCGFGYRIIDEVHLDFHANYRFDLITHIEQSISLSATLVSKDDFTKKMYQVAYPPESRIDVPTYAKYITSASWHYDFFNPNVIKTTVRGRTSYSHVAFEKSIMQSARLYKQYFLMINEVLRKTFLVGRKPEEKCLVYFATKKMCEDAVLFFKHMHPHLKIAKYNMGDKLANIMESDLCFATLGKAGAAIDIPLLTTVILTVGIDSIQSNLQSVGRLRNLKKLYNSDRVPLFVWFVCDNIQKHIRYHRNKVDLMKTEALNLINMQHNVSLGI